jgi:hypothetical protein
MNRGADFVKPLALLLRAQTRSLARNHTPPNQAALACAAHGAGQLRDWLKKMITAKSKDIKNEMF